MGSPLWPLLAPRWREDAYKQHRRRPLAEHVAGRITELRQLGRDEAYVRACEARMARLIEECGRRTPDAVSLAGLLRWRRMATGTVGTSAKAGANVRAMAARTSCSWAVRRKRADALLPRRGRPPRRRPW